MRSFTAVLVALSLATAISAHNNPHQNNKRLHDRKPRAWGARRDVSATATADDSDATAAPTTTYLTAVPSDFSTGAITISNTLAAAPEVTASAVGADRGETSALPTCSARGNFGDSCDPVTADCCATGLTCLSGSCARICTIAVTEPYCDASNPCDTSMGYVCTKNRCRPPTGATRVGLGSTCNQGGANTLFCYPNKAICADGTCQQCTQHS
ncbi:hypothetical protein MNV49_006259 [Pseudohyphozyma bogoriensis]|nr:hypothetical protein MNV49_006259 [Pseudohyphozyma bogoriensis]